jgi:hypothetical protein
VSKELETRTAITRREFTVESVMALLAGVTITVTGCGGSGYDSSPTPASPSPTPSASGDVSGAVSANHGHTASVTSAQVNAAGAVTLNIQGQATHPHTVDLSADEVRRIGQRQQVVKTSSADEGHTHTVTFN